MCYLYIYLYILWSPRNRLYLTRGPLETHSHFIKCDHKAEAFSWPACFMKSSQQRAKLYTPIPVFSAPCLSCNYPWWKLEYVPGMDQQTDTSVCHGLVEISFGQLDWCKLCCPHMTYGTSQHISHDSLFCVFVFTISPSCIVSTTAAEGLIFLKRILSWFIIPLAQRRCWGYIGFTLSVRPSICLSFHPPLPYFVSAV